MLSAYAKPVNSQIRLEASKTSDIYMQIFVQFASEMMGSDFRCFPILVFAIISQVITAMEIIEMMIPHKVVSGLFLITHYH